jgi:hypothetical protein
VIHVSHMGLPEWAFTFIAAWLLFVIVRSHQITVSLKSQTQRTAQEKKEIQRGLKRSTALECFMYVPASAALLVLLAPLVTEFVFKKYKSLDSPSGHRAFYTVVGLLSYEFPFEAIKRLLTNRAIRAVKALYPPMK